MDTDYSAVLGRFNKLAPCKRERTWRACCPVHGDRNPSLRLWVGKSGCLLARCWANRGCTFNAIVQAVGTELKDWFPPKDHERRRRPMSEQRRQVATYDYQDEKGNLLYQVVRWEPKDFRQRRPDGKGGWIWDLEGVERVIYRLPEILAAPSTRGVVIVEGEKDVEALRKIGFLATCNAGGAGKWTPDLGQALRGRKCVIIPDNDKPGWAHAAQVAGSLMQWGAESIRILSLPGLPDKGDVSDWLADFPGNKGPEARKAALWGFMRGTIEWVVAPRQAA